MKQLAQQINRQRMHIMQILEVESDTVETNSQITVSNLTVCVIDYRSVMFILAVTVQKMKENRLN